MSKIIRSSISSILLATYLLFADTTLFAQSSITSVGGSTSGTTGAFSFTLGQPADRSFCDTAITISVRTATLTEGVQQPYLSVEEISIPSIETLNIQVSVYPNPTQHKFHISVESVDKQLQFQLHNAVGQLMQHGTFQKETDVMVQEYPAGLYLLRITNTQGVTSKCYRVVIGH